MLTDLAQALAADGHQVTVVTSRQLIENPQAKLHLREQHSGVHIHRLRTTTFGRQRLLTRAMDYLSFYVATLLHLLALLRRGDTVIAKTDPPLISVVAATAAMLKGARLINWLQDVYPEIAFRLGALREHSVAGRLLLHLRNWSLRRAAGNVAVGTRMKQFVEQSIPRCGPVTVIHNWSQPLVRSAMPRDDNPYRRQLGLAGKVIFCYSGNLGRAHEFTSLVEAAKLLKDRSDIHFLIIGGGAQIQTLRDEINSRGLKNWSFLPYQPREKLSDSLGAADVHLVSLNPALEGLIVPSKIYGVLAAGRPGLFIGDEDGEVAGLLRQYDCGLVCSDNNGAGLAQHIKQLANSVELRRRFGANAATASVHQHRDDQTCQAWLLLLTTQISSNIAF